MRFGGHRSPAVAPISVVVRPWCGARASLCDVGAGDPAQQPAVAVVDGLAEQGPDPQAGGFRAGFGVGLRGMVRSAA